MFPLLGTKYVPPLNHRIFAQALLLVILQLPTNNIFDRVARWTKDELILMTVRRYVCVLFFLEKVSKYHLLAFK